MVTLVVEQLHNKEVVWQLSMFTCTATFCKTILQIHKLCKGAVKCKLKLNEACISISVRGESCKPALFVYHVNQSISQ